MNLQWTPVTSSNVEQAAYDAPTSRLYVAFKSGHSGYYADVPERVWHAFMSAYSHGTFVHEYLKGQYPWVKAGVGR